MGEIPGLCAPAHHSVIPCFQHEYAIREYSQGREYMMLNCISNLNTVLLGYCDYIHMCDISGARNVVIQKRNLLLYRQILSQYPRETVLFTNVQIVNLAVYSPE